MNLLTAFPNGRSGLSISRYRAISTLCGVAMLCAALLCWPLDSSAHTVFRDDFDDAEVSGIDWQSDEFAGDSRLSDWQRHWQVERWPVDQLQQLTIAPDIDGGVMVMQPHSSGWWEDYRAELTFRLFTGDFITTTLVIPRNRQRTGAPGSTQGGLTNSEYSLGGIMLRAPRPDVEADPGNWMRGNERYAFLSMGAVDTPGSYQFEDKTTRAAQPGQQNSFSQVLISNANASSAYLRLARIGSSVIALARPAQPAGPWRVLRRFARSDLPAALQAGLVAYSDYATVATCTYEEHNTRILLHACNDPSQVADPDLSVHFDFFRVRRPELPPELIGVDISNPAMVSDVELLAFLGLEP